MPPAWNLSKKATFHAHVTHVWLLGPAELRKVRGDATGVGQIKGWTQGEDPSQFPVAMPPFPN